MEVIKNRPKTMLGRSNESAIAEAINKLERIQKLEENPNYIETHCPCANKHFVLDETEKPNCICLDTLPKGKMFHLCESNHRTIIDNSMSFRPVKCTRCKEIQETQTKFEELAARNARKQFKEDNNLVAIPGYAGKTPGFIELDIKSKIDAKNLADELEKRGFLKK